MRWIEPAPIHTSLLGLHPIVAQALAKRGVFTNETADAFLHPDKYTPAPASELPGVQGAVDRLKSAIARQEPILVWGDFDVDGQTATTMVVQVLRSMGANVSYHLPVRTLQGHGIDQPGLKEYIDKGIKLILTCDTGISENVAAEYARQRGVDLIITDHHDLPTRIPLARAVINPKMLPRGNPLYSLAGVGVAYKLCEALLEGSDGDLEATDLLDLAALGLVADLATLIGDTRHLVQRGIKALRNTSRLGLLVLFELAELIPDTINETHISFTLAPRLNSLGRLGDANPIVEFLLTGDAQRARLVATQLENYNSQRRLLSAQVTQAAESLLRSDPTLLEAPVLIVAHPSWPASVLGIAASHLVERYGKPAVVLTTPPGEPAHGSARSIDGVHIAEAISVHADLLMKFGGHPMAAGLSLKPENLPLFRKRLNWTVERMLASVRREDPVLAIDGWRSLPDLTPELAAAIEEVSPYGPGNPHLILATAGLELKDQTFFGRNQEHIKLTVADSSRNTRQVIWWDGAGEILPQGVFDLAYTLRTTNWQGKQDLQMEFMGLRYQQPVEMAVKVRTFEVRDYRTETNLERVLALARKEASFVVWAEGTEKERVQGKDRTELGAVDVLVIWTIPPSPDELVAALEITNPKSIWIVAAHPQVEIAENFLARLSGILKHAITHLNGHVTYLNLASATAQKLSVVRSALGWLVARGAIAIKQESDLDLWVGPGATAHDPAESALYWQEIHARLGETAAYRAHFKRADKDSLFP